MMEEYRDESTILVGNMMNTMKELDEYCEKLKGSIGLLDVVNIMSEMIHLEGVLSTLKNQYNELTKLLKSMEEKMDLISQIKKPMLLKIVLLTDTSISKTEMAINKIKSYYGINAQKESVEKNQEGGE